MRQLLALMLLATTAHAGGSNELSIGSSNRTLRTSSANALTDDSLGGGGLAYARRLGIELVPGLALWGEGRFGWGGARGTMFQTLSTELDTLTFTAGGRARYPLHTRVIASARLDLGMARAALALRDGAGHVARDTGWGVMSSVAAGLDLLAIRRDGFALGLRLELGYAATSPISLTASPEAPSDGTLQLEMTAAGLGSLNLSGATFTASVVSEF